MNTLDTRDRRLTWGLFALLLASYAYFYQAGGWNENSRMDLIRALVEEQGLAIDRFHANTGDKALFGGHYYSDKAPGVSLLGAPVYAMLTPLVGLFESEHDFVVFASWLVTVCVVGVATALTAALLYRGSRRLGVSPQGAVLTSVAYGLGTIAFPLSTMLFSHQVAAAFLFGAFMLAWSCKRQYSDAKSALFAMLTAGAALVEFPTAPAAVLLFAYHIRGPLRARRALTFLGAAALPALVLGAYLLVAFDSPFRVGYEMLAEPTARSGMLGHGIFGLTYPKPGVLLELVIGRYRGLLPYSPVLVLAVPGFFRRSHGAERALAGAMVLYFLLFVSAYEWWQGGASFGSRHLAPMLPFLVLPLGWIADVRPKLVLAATLVSMGFMTVVTAVQPKPSDRLQDPFFGGIWPAFVRGQIALGNVCPYTGRAGAADHRPFVEHSRHDAFNIGMLIGGRGHRSLVPLWGLWLAGAFALVRATRREPDEEDRPPEHPQEERNQARAPAETREHA